MNNQLSEYFIDWKLELPRVCTRYEIRTAEVLYDISG